MLQVLQGRQPEGTIRNPAVAGEFLTYTDLPEIQGLMEHISLASVTWIQAFPDGSGSSTVEEASEHIHGLERRFEYARPSEAAFVQAFEPHVREILLDFRSFFGGHRVRITHASEPVVRFFQHEGQAGMFFPGIGLGSSFNTFSTNERDRLLRIVYESAVPELRAFVSPLQGTDVAYVGYAIHFGTRDFTNSVTNLALPETVILIASLESVVDHRELRITDTELVEESIVFFGSGESLRRVDATR
ncbi:MAG: hypothetical protein U5K81_12815 [Trueperaceae bacterium]|nr:hypothetical protein [Trueperaceae bacterium]